MTASQFKEFRTSLKEVLQKILIDEPVRVNTNAFRHDYGRYSYVLDEYVVPCGRNYLKFMPEIQRGTISQMDRSVYESKYKVVLVDDTSSNTILELQRRPKRSVFFRAKPYQPEESFIFGFIEKTISELAPHTEMKGI